MDRVSPIYRLGGIRLDTEDGPDSTDPLVVLKEFGEVDHHDPFASSVKRSRRAPSGSRTDNRFGPPLKGTENKHLKLLHSSYEDTAECSAIPRNDSCDSATASAANTPSSDGFTAVATLGSKTPIYSRCGNTDRRPVHHPQERFFPTSSYDFDEHDEPRASITPGSSPRTLMRWGSELSLSTLSMGPPESPKSSSRSRHMHSESHLGSVHGHGHDTPVMSPAIRSASRRSSQGDVSPCLQAVAVPGGEGLHEIQLTASYMHHRGNSPVRIPCGRKEAHRREGSPMRGPSKHLHFGREGSPTRAHFTRSFLHREGSPTRDGGCKKKSNVSPRRRHGNTSPRNRRQSAWQEKWGSMSTGEEAISVLCNGATPHAARRVQVLAERAFDDNLGAKMKEGYSMLKSFSMPGAHEPRRRQAEPVTRQPWPERNEERFKAGKAQMIGMEMNPFDYSSDDLCHLTLEIFQELELPERLGLPLQRLQRFILAVRDRMYENPYHNWMHVFDVTRTVYSLAHMSGVLGRLTDWEKMGLITATLCHDLEHPGVNNMFLAKSNSALAKMYKDTQVLEKHHSLRAFELMVDEEIDLLRGLNTSKYYEFRTMVTQAIMATDMARHADFVQKLDAIAAGTLVPSKQLETELLVKCADTSNVLKPFDVAKRWAIRITDEFFIQGDLERQSGMEVTRMCDRDTQSRVGMQKGFIDFVIGPFFSKLEAAYPGLAPCVGNMRTNRAEWDLYTDERLLSEVVDQARYSFLPSPPVSQSISRLEEAASS